MSIKINAQWCIEHKACYSRGRLKQLFDRDMTMTEVRDRRDGPWSDVSIEDRAWASRKLIMDQPRPLFLEWLARLAERSLARIDDPDPSSVAVIARCARTA